MFNLEHLNYSNAGGSQIFAQKVTRFNPCILQQFGTKIPFHRVIKRNGSFVVVAPRAYYSGFNSGYDLVSEVSYADSSYYNYTINIAKIRITTLMPGEVGISFESVLWIEFKPSSNPS